MKELSTNTTKEDMVLAFIQVLDIETHMAEFFLESAAWNIESAVSIYLENAQGSQSSSSFEASQFQVGIDGKQLEMMGYMGKRARTEGTDDRRARYLGMDVFIHGLPDGWSAKVSRHRGEIYFVNNNTGHRQNAVPPGFADIPPENEDDVPMRGEKEGEGSTPGKGGGTDGNEFVFAPPQPPRMDMQMQPSADSINVFEASGPLNRSGDSLGGTGSAGSVASTTGNTVGGDFTDDNTINAVVDEGESRAFEGTEDEMT